ncbi:MAG: hypothetical protein RBT75_17235 [Anaerolineae bacterium]|jgi:hypothetical protein|nr:hypothetical protein [Anaerolineae bacterium]
MENQLTPEAAEALGQVYTFLLRRRRERLARQAYATADAEPRPGVPASAAEQSPGVETTTEIVPSASELSTARSDRHG